MTIAHHVRRLIIVATASAAMVISSAHAFTVNYHSDNSAISDQQLFELVDWLSSQIGHNVPASPKVRIKVTTQADWKVSHEAYLYLHQIHLQRLVEGVRAPYADDYWVDVYTSRSWGSGGKDFQLQQLRSTIEDFFNGILKKTSP